MRHFVEYVAKAFLWLHLGPAPDQTCPPLPHPPDILIVACAFHTYHALKIGSRAVVDEAIHSGNFEIVIRLASETLSDFVASHGAKIIHEHMAHDFRSEPLHIHFPSASYLQDAASRPEGAGTGAPASQ